MSFRSISSNVQIVIGAAVLSIGAVAGGVLFQQHLTGTITEYTEQLQLLADAAETERIAGTLERELEESAEEREDLDSYFLDVVQIAQFLESVEQYADQTGLILDSQELRTTEPGEFNVASVSIPYEVQGDRAAVIRFIEMMETLPYHSHLDTVEVERVNPDVSLVRAFVTVTISYVEHD